jgi:hypothetical protein
VTGSSAAARTSNRHLLGWQSGQLDGRTGPRTGRALPATPALDGNPARNVAPSAQRKARPSNVSIAATNASDSATEASRA